MIFAITHLVDQSVHESNHVLVMPLIGNSVQLDRRLIFQLTPSRRQIFQILNG